MEAWAGIRSWAWGGECPKPRKQKAKEWRRGCFARKATGLREDTERLVFTTVQLGWKGSLG